MVLLLNPTTLGGGWDLRALWPPLRSCPHLLGGKAWISPSPLALPLKRSHSPSHLAPLPISSPPGKALCSFIKRRRLPWALTCSACPPALVLRLPKGHQWPSPLSKTALSFFSCCHSQICCISNCLHNLIISVAEAFKVVSDAVGRFLCTRVLPGPVPPFALITDHSAGCALSRVCRKE